MLSENDRFQLKKMLDASPVDDHTAKIRENQHSAEIRRCIQLILDKKALGMTKAEVEAAVAVECSFLFFHYFEIYNMVMKDVDITILHRLLDVLSQIEKGECDQHEGSYLVGKLLKEIYIDGIVRNTRDTKPQRPAPKSIGWAEFKKRSKP